MFYPNSLTKTKNELRWKKMWTRSISYTYI